MVVDLEATPIYLSAEEEEGDVDISGKYWDGTILEKCENVIARQEGEIFCHWPWWIMRMLL
jgi:hypothetical protein